MLVLSTYTLKEGSTGPAWPDPETGCCCSCKVNEAATHAAKSSLCGGIIGELAPATKVISSSDVDDLRSLLPSSSHMSSLYVSELCMFSSYSIITVICYNKIGLAGRPQAMKGFPVSRGIPCGFCRFYCHVPMFKETWTGKRAMLGEGREK